MVGTVQVVQVDALHRKEVESKVYPAAYIHCVCTQHYHSKWVDFNKELEYIKEYVSCIMNQHDDSANGEEVSRVGE